jgi:hypothetical protein
MNDAVEVVEDEDQVKTPVEPSEIPEASETFETTEKPVETVEETTVEPESSLDDLLREYDESVHGNQLQDNYVPPLQDSTSGILDHNQQLDALEAREAEAQRRSEILEQAVTELQQRELARIEREDFSNLVKEANASIEDVQGLFPDFAERWLLSQAMVDPTLKACWDNRHNTQLSATTQKQIRAYMRAALARLQKDARSLPDPIATFDRELVAASVRDGGAPVKRHEPAPNFGSLSNRELNEFSERFGFTAI